MATKEEILHRLSENKTKLQSEFGLNKIGLFGSYALDKQSETSDIDLLYELERGQKMSFSKLVRLEAFLGQILDNTKIELVNSRYINPVIQADMEQHLIYV